MELSENDLAFVSGNPSVAIITVGGDGRPKAVRAGLSVVDGKLWSSSTQDRVRTARLRKDPHCTLFVYDSSFGYLTLEADVTILEGDDVPAQTLRMMRQMQGRPEGPVSWFGGMLDEPDFLQAMRDEGRIIYQFDVTRAYGLH